MVKQFESRITKKQRTIQPIISDIHQQKTRLNDEKLLKGAQLTELSLKEIKVKEQVRTKFQEDSLKDLAENIRINGLIQPLVIHRENSDFVLLCGERRYRAMTMIGMTHAPCFVLEGKSREELMAIQFSENSSREELHYIDKADGIYHYQKATGASERKIEADLGISKSEVHRALMIAKLPPELKEAAKTYNIEKYVLVEFQEESDPQKQMIMKGRILSGSLRKRHHLRDLKKQFMIL
jgi:ParB family chromosome partitioning protein